MVTDLDPTTIIIVATVAFAVPTVLFCVLTATRHNDPASRTWSVGPIALAAAMTAVATETGDLERSLEAAVAGGVVFCVGATWSGLRTHLGRPDPYVRFVGAGSVLAAVASGAWPASAEALAGAVVAVGAGLVLVELTGERGPRTERILLRVAHGAILAWGLGVVGTSIAGSEHTGRLDDAETLAMLALAEAVALVALMTMRAVATPESTTATTALPFLDRPLFLRLGTDRLERAALLGVRSQFFVLFTDGLDVIEAAYGRAAVRVATDHVAHVVRTKVPASALIARLADGQVAVLSTSSRSSTPEELVAAVQTGLATTPAPERLPLRIDVGVRIAATDPTAAQLRAATGPLEV